MQLLVGIVAGDPLTYTAFYDRHAPRILGILIRALRHRAERRGCVAGDLSSGLANRR